ncbi:MAG: phosphotriesterase [Candidatus Hodarchaeota archaeon]
MNHKIMTVTGEIPSNEMGFTLPHEHILVDFIGAEETGRHRYDSEEVIKVMLPYLMDIYKLGVATFIDCTPMYLARDVKILKELATKTNLNILTNTGLYGRVPYIPEQTYTQSIEELADHWIQEVNEGIEGTTIKPGFIKTAVDGGKFTDIEKKLIEVAAVASNESNLTIATHTCFGEKALQILNVLKEYAVSPQKWIFVHANIEEKIELILRVAERGAWIELDGIGQEGQDERILNILDILIEQEYQDQILLSQDAGCYFVGEPNGGEIRSFSPFITEFIPLLHERGILDKLIQKFTIYNPAAAFSI